MHVNGGEIEKVMELFERHYTRRSTARHRPRSIGIRLSAARTYLKRIMTKYQQVGPRVCTKLELAEQVRSEHAADSCRAFGA